MRIIKLLNNSYYICIYSPLHHHFHMLIIPISLPYISIYLYVHIYIGGYMFPIRGLVVKQDHTAPWVVYSKNATADGRESYDVVAAFPPYPTPDRSEISEVFTR